MFAFQTLIVIPSNPAATRGKLSSFLKKNDILKFWKALDVENKVFYDGPAISQCEIVCTLFNKKIKKW
jgi:hypothetical protein